jgi:hypothetical protein
LGNKLFSDPGVRWVRLRCQILAVPVCLNDTARPVRSLEAGFLCRLSTRLYFKT